MTATELRDKIYALIDRIAALKDDDEALDTLTDVVDYANEKHDEREEEICEEADDN